ncbi:MAG: hypothetical protein J6B10_08940 [Lachnospiraceae bacterium]|nr:hypothetical protein [Lachnospiraceae bacterium]
MSLVAPVVDGKIQDTSASSNSLSASQTKDSNSTLDKDAFLQLLVAQMKYQDPLEPTSNTEYISQFATFSELEQMQNMSATMDLQRASSLVGENVILKVTAKNGGVSYVTGPVDYVEMENNKAYLSVKGNLYSMDDLVTVVDSEYQVAFDKANDLLTDLYKLPTYSALTIDDMDAVLAIKKTYNAMTEYEQSFLTDDEKTVLTKYFDKMKELMLAAGIEEPEEEKKKTMEQMMEELLGKIDDLVDGVGNISVSGGSGSDTTNQATQTDDQKQDDTTDETNPTDETASTDKTTSADQPESSENSDQTGESGSSNQTGGADDSTADT